MPCRQSFTIGRIGETSQLPASFQRLADLRLLSDIPKGDFSQIVSNGQQTVTGKSDFSDQVWKLAFQFADNLVSLYPIRSKSAENLDSIALRPIVFPVCNGSQYWKGRLTKVVVSLENRELPRREPSTETAFFGAESVRRILRLVESCRQCLDYVGTKI